MSANDETTGTAARAVALLHRAILVVVVLAVVLPLLWTARLALRPIDAYIGNPSGLGGGFTFENFTTAWQGGLDSGIVNALIVVPLASVLATALATLAGFGLAKTPIPFERFWLALVAFTIAVPLTSLAVPIFDQALQFGYLDSRVMLAVVYGSLFAGWGTLFLRSYFQGLPDELLAAARVDGASMWRIFVTIALPLAGPAIASVAMINLFVIWSELIIALVMLPSPENQTVAATLAQFSTQFRAGGPLTAAAVVIAVLPIVAAFGVGQRWLRAEILGGAVKG